jgi:hypothetical protein
MRTIQQVRQKGVTAMAWLSFLLAIVGGAALTATFVSSWAVAIVGWIPGHTYTHAIALIVLVVEVVLLIRDIWMDGEPNHVALWVAITAPTVARMVSGKLAAKVSHLSHQLLEQLNPTLTGWLGTTAALAIAGATIAAAMVLAQRAVSRGTGRGR